MESKTSKTISVRFDLQLYDKILQHELQNSDLIRKAVRQYFRLLEPNSKIPLEGAGSNPFCNTSSYNVELVDLLKDQVSYLKDQNDQLLKINGSLSMASLPFFDRVKLLVSGKK